ncbi:alternate-type signal peptide domain-containing protein [Microbacterium saccharophilum]|uniref:Alternate-type signal peptide domain-containing protein n=1 Tax=Microbacterium saccharophilum TaxID=1213358 RepID=A0A5C8I9P1_9MICO|nr:alternate-type signal peptide domain-containing protein [Microbacterium saccharophilum]TXK15004.1 alternate-type signal peptide domain-containing protein [Microbacterium saccharophilum]GEP47403.1 hypothetical protein MSA03_09110 [Microbacterium saccharophilum]
MNKIAKASIATAAGVALLLGGAGTFATWNASAAEAGSSTIVAGNLVVEDTKVAGTWTANGSPITIATYAVSPGDVLTYTKTMKIKADGDSLQAIPALTGGSIVAANPTNAADQALAASLLKTATLTASGTGIVQTGDTFTVVPGAGTTDQIATITATITFPKSATAGAENASMNGAVNLTGFTVSLTQKTA